MDLHLWNGFIVGFSSSLSRSDLNKETPDQSWEQTDELSKQIKSDPLSGLNHSLKQDKTLWTLVIVSFTTSTHDIQSRLEDWKLIALVWSKKRHSKNFHASTRWHGESSTQQATLVSVQSDKKNEIF